MILINWHSAWHFSGILSDIFYFTFYLTCILTSILAVYLTFYLAFYVFLCVVFSWQIWRQGGRLEIRAPSVASICRLHVCMSACYYPPPYSFGLCWQNAFDLPTWETTNFTKRVLYIWTCIYLAPPTAGKVWWGTRHPVEWSETESCRIEWTHIMPKTRRCYKPIWRIVEICIRNVRRCWMIEAARRNRRGGSAHLWSFWPHSPEAGGAGLTECQQVCKEWAQKQGKKSANMCQVAAEEAVQPVYLVWLSCSACQDC